jgi:hypothetical protein
MPSRTAPARWQSLAVIPAGWPVTAAASRITWFRDAHLMEAALAERRDCPYCAAPAGELCRTTAGGLAFYHHARLWPAEGRQASG